MKINSNLLIAVIFIVFGIVTFYFIKNKNLKSNIVSEDRNFGVENIDDVQKIFLAQKNGDNILLTRNDNSWTVNNKFNVFPNTIHHFLETIKNLKVNSIPPKAAYEEIMKGIATSGIKVEIYNRKNELIKTYYVGGVTQNEEGLYCLMDGSNQPYITNIGTAPINLRVRYEIKEEDWRDRSLFDLPSKEINNVSIRFPYEPERDLNLKMENNKFYINNLESSISNNSYNINFLKSIFSSFEPISAEAIVNDHRAKDSICVLTPYSTITIKFNDRPDSVHLKLYPIPEPSNEAIALDKEFLQKKNFFRFYACRQNGDFLLLQLSQIQKIFFDIQGLQSQLKN